MSDRRSRRTDGAATILIWVVAALVTAVFVGILFDLAWHGAAQVSWSFLTDPVENSGRAGGIGPIIVSTLLILGVCLTAALPLGLGTAVLLAEFTPTRGK